MFNIAHVVTVNNTVKLVLTFDQTTFSLPKSLQICNNLQRTRTKYQKQTKVNISKQKYRKTTMTIEMQLLVHNYKSYSTIRNHFCLPFTTCALSHKKQFSNFWQNNCAFQYFVCLIKGYLQKKTIKTKKRKKKLFTAQVESGSPDCHDTMISTWPPELAVIFPLYFPRNKALELHYNSRRFSFVAKFPQNLCQLTRKNLFTNFAQNNFSFHRFVCLIKRYLQKKSIKRKKRKKQLFTAQVEPGPPHCHDTTISPWPPELAVISFCVSK